MGRKSICLSRIYSQAVAMTLCFELQQSHEVIAGVTWGVYIKQILYIQGKLCSAVQICNLRRKMGVFKTRTVNTRYTNTFLPITPPL